MDGNAFDGLARTLGAGRSRRWALGALGAAVLGAAGVTDRADGAAARCTTTCPDGQVLGAGCRCLCPRTGRPPVDGSCCPEGQAGCDETIEPNKPKIRAVVEETLDFSGSEAMLVSVRGSGFPPNTPIDLQWTLLGDSGTLQITNFDLVSTDVRGDFGPYALNRAEIGPLFRPIPCINTGYPTQIEIAAVEVATGSALATRSAPLTCG